MGKDADAREREFHALGRRLQAATDDEERWRLIIAMIELRMVDIAGQVISGYRLVRVGTDRATGQAVWRLERVGEELGSPGNN